MPLSKSCITLWPNITDVLRRRQHFDHHQCLIGDTPDCGISYGELAPYSWYGANGLESDDAGRIYLTGSEQNAILRRHPDGQLETVVHDPRLLWPDTMSVATDGYLYVTANQLHRQAMYQHGVDRRERPYVLFRTRIDAGPVLLGGTGRPR
jgi:hypothetical protein